MNNSAYATVMIHAVNPDATITAEGSYLEGHDPYITLRIGPDITVFLSSEASGKIVKALTVLTGKVAA